MPIESISWVEARIITAVEGKSSLINPIVTVVSRETQWVLVNTMVERAIDVSVTILIARHCHRQLHMRIESKT